MSITDREVVGPAVVSLRSRGIDVLRGLAIVLMLSDHVALFLGADWWRLSVGRLAMPLFFVVSGHLVSRLSWRHGWVAFVGLLLPLGVPWVDAPNVLLAYAVGALLIVAMRWADIPVWVVAVLGLTIAANGWTRTEGPSYDFPALYGLMAIGAGLARSSFAWADRGPRWLSWVGRYPLSVYVGHLVVLEVVRVSTGGGW